jgi:class 3 adenylate cyclase
VFTVVFATVFAWVYASATQRATERLRSDLNETLKGASTSIDAEELLALYREGTPNAAGFSDDPRFTRLIGFLDIVHHVERRAWPYTFVRGGEPSTRRVTPQRAEPEFVYIIDLYACYDPQKSAKFLASDTGSPWGLATWEKGELTERPGIYTDAFGSWMTSYAPIRDLGGHVVAIMGVDFEASEVKRVQRTLAQELVVVFFLAYAATLLLTYLAATVIARRSKRAAAGPRSVRETHEVAEPGDAPRERVAMAVLAAEITGLSELAQKAPAVTVHRVLGELLASFDELAKRHGLERIVTASGTYIVVAGLHDSTKARPAAVAAMALAMLEKVTRTDLTLRIGAHVGDVVVVKEPEGYGMFGDAVRVADRLEKLGQRGRVHVSSDMAKAIEADYVMEPAGGEGETFFVLRPRR